MTVATRCRCLACQEANGRQVVEYIMPNQDPFLYSDHYIVVRSYAPLEHYNHRGCYWTCEAIRVRDAEPDEYGRCHEYVAPASWFRPVE